MTNRWSYSFHLVWDMSWWGPFYRCTYRLCLYVFYMTDQCHLPLAFFIWKSDLICINSYFSCSRKESLGHVCRRLRYSQIRYNAYCQFYCQFYINAPFVFCRCFISISEYCDLFALYMYFCLCLNIQWDTDRQSDETQTLDSTCIMGIFYP